MAGLLMWAASTLALLGQVLVAGSASSADSIIRSDNQLQSSIIRRHDVKDGSTEVLLNSNGELRLRPRHRRSRNGTVAQDPTNSWCNHDYAKGTENSNSCDCDQCVQILKEDDCRHAANYLKANGVKAEAVNHSGFVVNDGWQNPLPYPKNCFIMANGSVFFNPTPTMPTAWEGTPLCERMLYPDGAENTDGSTGCTGDFEAISDYNDCVDAFNCAEGQDGCKMPDFENAALYKNESKPKGCFREPGTGCFNFNHVETAPSTVTGKPVCQLKISE